MAVFKRKKIEMEKKEKHGMLIIEILQEKESSRL